MEYLRKAEEIPPLGSLYFHRIAYAGCATSLLLSSTKSIVDQVSSNMLTGFDFSVASTSFALPSFQKEFGELFPTSPSGYIVPARLASGMIGASAGGEFVGVMLAAYLMDVLGRKHVMSLGSVVTAIGVAMQMPAHGWRLFLSGRFVNGNKSLEGP